MPWCQACERFYNPNSLPADGACPGCGQPLAEPASTRAGAAAGPGEEDQPVPWHFKVMVVAVVVYLGWRVVELVAAVVS